VISPPRIREALVVSVKIARCEYTAWLPPRRAAILALERESPISSSSRTAAPILATTRRFR
jgi:hypothetical protein